MAVVMEMVPKAPAGAVKIRLMHPRSNERDYADTTLNIITNVSPSPYSSLRSSLYSVCYISPSDCGIEDLRHP